MSRRQHDIAAGGSEMLNLFAGQPEMHDEQELATETRRELYLHATAVVPIRGEHSAH